MIVHSNIFGLTLGILAIAALCTAQALDLLHVRSVTARLVSLLAILMFAVSLAVVLNRFLALG